MFQPQTITSPSKEYSIAEQFANAIQKINEKKKEADFIALMQPRTDWTCKKSNLITCSNLCNKTIDTVYHHFTQNNPSVLMI